MRNLLFAVFLLIVCASITATPAKADCPLWETTTPQAIFVCDDYGQGMLCSQIYFCMAPDGTYDLPPYSGYWDQLAAFYEVIYGTEPDPEELLEFESAVKFGSVY